MRRSPKHIGSDIRAVFLVFLYRLNAWTARIRLPLRKYSNDVIATQQSVLLAPNVNIIIFIIIIDNLYSAVLEVLQGR